MTQTVLGPGGEHGGGADPLGGGLVWVGEHATQGALRLTRGDRASVSRGPLGCFVHRIGAGSEGQEPAGDSDALAVPRVGRRPHHPSRRPGHRGVGQAALLVEPEPEIAGGVRRQRRLEMPGVEQRVAGAQVGEDAFDGVGDEHHVELEAL